MIKEDCICELILLSKHVPFIGRVKYMDLFPQGSQATQHWAEAKEMVHPPLPNVSKRDKAYCGQSKDCVIGHGAAFFHYEAFALLCSWEAFLLLCFGGCCVLVQMKPATGPVEVLLPEVWDRVRVWFCAAFAMIHWIFQTCWWKMWFSCMEQQFRSRIYDDEMLCLSQHTAVIRP